jgi:hypothetical protein
MNTVLPLISGVLSLVFTAFLLRRFVSRRGTHLLLWSIGMLFYSVGGLCEAYNGGLGWDPLVFRLWYICGAFLAAAWLGQGTLYLLAGRRWWVTTVAGMLALGSLYAVARVFTAQLDPSQIAGGAALTGRVITTPGVRTLTPFFNVFGTLTLAGGAIWSALQLLRKRMLPHRVIGNILIAAGALMPAIGGSFSRFGTESLLYVSELLGALLMFIGFLLSTRIAGNNPAENAAGLPGNST